MGLRRGTSGTSATREKAQHEVAERKAWRKRGSGGAALTSGERSTRNGSEPAVSSADPTTTIPGRAPTIVIAAASLLALAMLVWLRASRRRVHRLYRIVPGREETASAALIRDLPATWLASWEEEQGACFWREGCPLPHGLSRCRGKPEPTAVRWFLQLPDEEDLFHSFEGALEESYRGPPQAGGRCSDLGYPGGATEEEPADPRDARSPRYDPDIRSALGWVESSFVDGIVAAMSGYEEPTAFPGSRGFVPRRSAPMKARSDAKSGRTKDLAD